MSDEIPDGRNIATAVNNWESPVRFDEQSNTYGLVRALLSQAQRIDDDLEAIYDAHHINSATGDDLDKFGDLVNVDRKSGEGDDKYRSRIKAQFRVSTINTTFDEFAEFAAVVLNTDVGNLTFSTPYDSEPASVTIKAQPSAYNNSSLTSSELTDLLNNGVPAGHEVRIIESGTFRLKSDGDTDDPDKGLTSDSISSGGTLTADLA